MSNNVIQEKVIDSASLFYQQGGSDKVYIVELKEQSLQNGLKGYVVHCHYGRRGSTLNFANKTPSPVSFVSAYHEFNKVVTEKQRKGYQVDVAGSHSGPAPTAATTTPRPQYTPMVFGLLPQLLNPVKDDSQLEDLLSDDDWHMQEKKDGERRMIQRLKGGSWKGYNKKGNEVALPSTLTAVLDSLALPEELMLDGEVVGDVYYPFDILFDGKSLANEPFYVRRTYLQNLPEMAGFHPVPVVIGEKAKRAYLEQCRELNLEGVVFKRSDSSYTPGRPNSGGDQLKYKFVESATVLVTKTTKGKRSVSIGAYDDSGKFHSLGNVTIPPNHEVPSANDIVEIRYLYAYKGGALAQPVYLGKRTDQDAEDCKLSQLKYKSVLETIPVAESTQDSRWAW